VSDPAALSLIVLFLAGLAAGYVNSVAGGGSLLTLPALIFTGLDPSVANATNRIAVLFQNAAAIVAFRRGGLHGGRLAVTLLVPSMVAAAAGAWVATLLEERELSLAIAIAMLSFLALMLVRRPQKDPQDAPDGEIAPPRFHWTMVLGFSAIGFYAGFLQAGVGLLILLYLSALHGTALLPANAIKVIVVLGFAAMAIVVFGLSGVPMDPVRGTVLAVATTLGGYLGARDTLRRGERFVRWTVVVAVAASAVKLVFDALT